MSALSLLAARQQHDAYATAAAAGAAPVICPAAAADGVAHPVGAHRAAAAAADDDCEGHAVSSDAWGKPGHLSKDQSAALRTFKEQQKVEISLSDTDVRAACLHFPISAPRW